MSERVKLPVGPSLDARIRPPAAAPAKKFRSQGPAGRDESPSLTGPDERGEFGPAYPLESSRVPEGGGERAKSLHRRGGPRTLLADREAADGARATVERQPEGGDRDPLHIQRHRDPLMAGEFPTRHSPPSVTSLLHRISPRDSLLQRAPAGPIARPIPDFRIIFGAPPNRSMGMFPSAVEASRPPDASFRRWIGSKSAGELLTRLTSDTPGMIRFPRFGTVGEG